MSKRGGAEMFILIAVLLIALVGLYYVMKGPGKATGYNFECNVDCTPSKPVKSELFLTTSSEEAQSMCRAYAAEQCRPGVPSRAVARDITGYAARGDPLYYYNYPGSESTIVACLRACYTYEGNNPNCLIDCQQLNPVGDPYAWRPEVTGEFAIPGQREYGGAIRGVSEESAKAFGGRAYEVPSRCFDCSCGNTYSTPHEEAAAMACANYCGGAVKEASC